MVSGWVVTASANDWPQWRGLGRDGISTETVNAAWPDSGPTMLWRAAVGVGFSSVAISHGRACTIGNTNGQDTIWCFDAQTGKAHWVYDSQSRVIASTMVADGKIYLPSEKHLDVLATGKTMKLLSRISLGAATWATPVVANGTLYVTSKNYLWAVRQPTGTAANASP